MKEQEAILEEIQGYLADLEDQDKAYDVEAKDLRGRGRKCTPGGVGELVSSTPFSNVSSGNLNPE